MTRSRIHLRLACLLFAGQLLLAVNATAQLDSLDDAPPPASRIIHVPDEHMLYGVHLRNRADSLFWFDLHYLFTVPPGGGATYNRAIDSVPTRYVGFDPSLISVQDSAVRPLAAGSTRLIIEFPTYRDTIRLDISAGRSGLVVNMDTTSLGRIRCGDCYTSDVWDTVGGGYRRSRISDIAVGMDVNDVYRMLGRHGWYGWTRRYENSVRWALDMRESLYMRSAGPSGEWVVDSVWIAPLNE